MIQQAMQWQQGVQVSYYKANDWGYLHVNLQVINQEIAIHENAFRKILGIDYRVECGCREITLEQANDMGFIFPTNRVGR